MDTATKELDRIPFYQKISDDYYDLCLYDPDRKIRVGKPLFTGLIEDCRSCFGNMESDNELKLVQFAELTVQLIHCNTGQVFSV